MNRARRLRKDDVDDLLDILDTPTAIEQINDLLDEYSEYADLAALLSEPAYRSLDVASKVKVGLFRAGGGYSDVYQGKMLPGPVDEPRVLQLSANKKDLQEYMQANSITFKKVAVKRFRFFFRSAEDGVCIKTILRELRVWARLQHENVLLLLGFTLVDSLPSLVSEWMENGTLTHFIAKNPQANVRLMVLQIANGLSYLHENGVVHADLKPDNILVSHDGRPLLSDFGVSRIVIESQTMTGTMNLKGNVRYMAPELLGPQAEEMGHQFHTKASDVWAFGMVVYELLCGNVPYYHLPNDIQVMNEIFSNRFPLRPVSSTHEDFDEMWYICWRCWWQSPWQRPNCSRLVNTLKTPLPPDSVDPKKVPVQFKKEHDDWLAVYNPGVPRTLDVELMHILNHDSYVYCVRFSPNGKYIATGCVKTAQIYDVTTGAKICIFNDPNANAQENVRIWSVRFSPDGRYLATGGEDRLVRIWNIAVKRIHRVLDGHTDTVLSLDFSCDGRFIVSGSGDMTTRIWDMESDNVLVLSPNVPPGVYAGVYSVAISPNMKLVAVGCWDGIVRIWNADAGHLVEQLQGHTECVRSVAFTPDGRGLVSGSYDRTTKRWDLTGFLRNPDRDQPFSATIQTDPASSPFSPNLSTLLPPESANSRMTVLAEAASTNGHGNRGSVCSLDLAGHKSYVRSVAVSPDGKWAVSGSDDRDVRIWNSSTAEAVMLLRGHSNTVTSVDLNPAGDFLATGSNDQTVRIWRLTRVTAYR